MHIKHFHFYHALWLATHAICKRTLPKSEWLDERKDEGTGEKPGKTVEAQTKEGWMEEFFSIDGYVCHSNIQNLDPATMRASHSQHSLAVPTSQINTYVAE